MRKQAQKNSVTSPRSHTWEGAKPELEARTVWFQSPDSCTRPTVISRNGNLRIRFLASLSFHGGGSSAQLLMAASVFPSLFFPPWWKGFLWFRPCGVSLPTAIAFQSWKGMLIMKSIIFTYSWKPIWKCRLHLAGKKKTAIFIFHVP